MTHRDGPRAGLRTPQFRLRTLMIVVSLVCMLLAVLKFFSPAVIAGVVLLVLSIAAHVAGNALGTQLRDHGSRPLPGEPPPHRLPPAAGKLSAADFAAASRLSHREAVGFIVVPCTLVGALVGGLGGGYWLVQALQDKATLAKLALGCSAAAVLGGILGFLLSAFLKVLISANLEASREK